VRPVERLIECRGRLENYSVVTVIEKQLEPAGYLLADISSKFGSGKRAPALSSEKL
jgi:hypothetical protein